MLTAWMIKIHIDCITNEPWNATPTPLHALYCLNVALHCFNMTILLVDFITAICLIHIKLMATIKSDRRLI